MFYFLLRPEGGGSRSRRGAFAEGLEHSWLCHVHRFPRAATAAQLTSFWKEKLGDGGRGFSFHSRSPKFTLNLIKIPLNLTHGLGGWGRRIGNSKPASQPAQAPWWDPILGEEAETSYSNKTRWPMATLCSFWGHFSDQILCWIETLLSESFHLFPSCWTQHLVFT